MNSTPLMYAVDGALIAVLTASAASWLWIAGRWRRGVELLEYEPRRRVPWSGWQLLALFGAYLFLQLGCGRAALEWARTGAADSAAHVVRPLGLPGESDTIADSPEAKTDGEQADSGLPLSLPEIRVVLLANAAVNALFGFAVVVVLRFGRAAASWADLGLSLSRLAYTLRAGLVGFCAVSVPVYFLQGLLSLFWRGEHPIVKFLSQTSELSGVLIAAGAAVAVAPLVEELLFRAVLQGWLESNEPRVAASPTTPAGGNPVVWRPIVITSAIFALLHSGHGPDPIPLFFLALALGYLFQRTHRVWASVTIHFLFNLSSLLMLAAKLSTEAAP